MKLWDISQQDPLDRETRARIIGCQTQMESFNFFYGLNLAYRLYAMTDNLSKTMQKESFSAIDGQKTAELTRGIKTNENRWIGQVVLWYNCQESIETWVHRISSIAKKEKKAELYKSIEQHFQVEGYHYNAEAHHPSTPGEYYRSIYFEAIDILTFSIKSRFEQPSFPAFSKLESYLLQAINHTSIDEEILEF